MSLKSVLKRSAKFHHKSCDGRFCKLDEHPEMRAIERIAELEAVVEAAEKDKAEIAKDAQYISSRCLKAEARIAELEAVAEAVIALQDDMDYPYGHPMLEVEKALRAAGYLTVIR